MKLKEKLIEGQLTVGSWITLAHPAIAEIMANAGFEWLAVRNGTIILDSDLSGFPAL